MAFTDPISRLALLAADLPAPPAWERWLLERPLAAAGVLVVCGVVGLIVMNQRGRLKAGFGLLVGLCAAGGVVWGIGAAVQTDREILEAATKRLILAVTNSDVPTADQMIHDRLVIAGAGTVIPGAFGKADALAAVKGYKWFRIDEWSERPDGAVLDGPNVGRTRSVVRAKSSFYGDSTFVPMTWEFTWGRGADGAWRVTRVELVSMWGQSPPEGWARNLRAAAAAGPTDGVDPSGGRGPTPLTRDEQ